MESEIEREREKERERRGDIREAETNAVKEDGDARSIGIVAIGNTSMIGNTHDEKKEET